jgi:RNA polymerase sigma-70 factor (ECF subfamily)
MDLSQEKAILEDSRSNPAVFGLIFDKYYGKLFGYTLKRVGRVEIAEDIVSEVFFKAVKSVSKFRWQNISVSSWLYKITMNEIKMWFRKKSNFHWSLEVLQEEVGFEPVGEVDLEEEATKLQEQLESEELFKNVCEVVQQLPLKYQEVISLRFFEEKTTVEIAEILGKREGTVRSLLSRGIGKLRSQFILSNPGIGVILNEAKAK